MPRYFFNVNGAVHSSDDDGEEFADDKAAWKEATLVAGEMFKDIEANSSRARNGIWKSQRPSGGRSTG
jgi:hypothetical protein